MYKAIKDKPKFSGKEKSIAVLPFENMSGDKNNEYLSDGFTEEITTQLSKIRDLKVKARTSAKLFKNSNKPIKEIAKDLEVEAILEGSLQRSGNALRITAQLIDANTEEHIWAEKYDRNMEAIFAIQSEVAQEIARQLNVRISTNEKNSLHKKPTENVAAYEDYLKGWQLVHDLTDARTEKYIDRVKLAKQNFLDALKKDSTFALAWAGLAVANFGISLTDPPDHHRLLNKAMECAITSIRYGPDLPETHMALGDVFKFITLNPALSLNMLYRGVELDPKNANAYTYLAYALIESGRFRDAEANLIKAKQLDPQSSLMGDAWSYYYYCTRNSEKLAEIVKEFNIQEGMLGVLFLRDQYDSLLIYGRQYSNPFMMGIAFAKLGVLDSARKMIDTINATFSESYRDVCIGIIHGWLNEKKMAMDHIERAFEMRSSLLIQIKVDKIYDPLRNEKRFKELLKRMGSE